MLYNLPLYEYKISSSSRIALVVKRLQRLLFLSTTSLQLALEVVPEGLFALDAKHMHLCELFALEKQSRNKLWLILII